MLIARVLLGLASAVVIPAFHAAPALACSREPGWSEARTRRRLKPTSRLHPDSDGFGSISFRSHAPSRFCNSLPRLG